MKLWDNTQKDRILVQMLVDHNIEDNPLTFSLLNIRNPRSFKPSKGFSIVTRDLKKRPVDVGGQDINLVMKTMNFFDDFKVIPSDSTNGAINTYEIEFRSKVFMI